MFFHFPCENRRLGGLLNQSMANFGVRSGRGRGLRKCSPCQSIYGNIPRRRRSCLQKRKRFWENVIFDAHGGSVNLVANSSTEHGPSRNPESQKVENCVIVKLRNPKGKVDIAGGESSFELSWSALNRRIEELKYATFEVAFMVKEGLADPKVNKRGRVRRRSVCKGPAVPKDKRMKTYRRFQRKAGSGLHEDAIVLPLNEGDLARTCKGTFVDSKDGDSTTSQLQSSSVIRPEKINPQHMPRGLLIDVDDEREQTCKRWSSRNRAHKKAVRLVRRNQVPKLDKHLDTNIIDKYMEQLWKNLPEEKQESCTFLDCLWFSMYLEEALSFNVLKWTKAKNIFSRRYVFIPIVHWSHWNLLILCHFGEDFATQERTPCMLLLDSLKETNPNRLEPLIRKFLVEIHKEEGRQDGDKIIANIPLLVPEVPQQTNGNDCGVFLLHFIDLFLQLAPENFSISNGCYPYFLTKDWFNCEEIGKLRKDIYNMCLEEQHCVSQMTDRRISTRSKKFQRFVHTDCMSNWIDLSRAA